MKLILIAVFISLVAAGTALVDWNRDGIVDSVVNTPSTRSYVAPATTTSVVPRTTTVARPATTVTSSYAAPRYYDWDRDGIIDTVVSSPVRTVPAPSYVAPTYTAPALSYAPTWGWPEWSYPYGWGYEPYQAYEAPNPYGNGFTFIPVGGDDDSAADAAPPADAAAPAPAPAAPAPAPAAPAPAPAPAAPPAFPRS